MRLIDADALIDEIKKKMPTSGTRGVFLAFIDEQPTVYDVEDIMKQLKEKRRNNWKDDSDYGIGKWSAFNEAISIVKAGKVVQHD